MRNVKQEQYLEALEWAWAEDNINHRKSCMVPFRLWDDDLFDKIATKYHERTYEIIEEIKNDGCETTLESLGMSDRDFY